MRYMVGSLASIHKTLDDNFITPFDHLIKKEVIAVSKHLTNHSQVSTYPSIDLFCCRWIKNPLPVCVCQLCPSGWVTMLLTKLISLLVLWFEVEDVHWQNNASEKGIILCWKVSLELAIVIIEQNIGKVLWCRVHWFDKVLKTVEILESRIEIRRSHLNPTNSLSTEHCTSCQDHSTAAHN